MICRRQSLLFFSLLIAAVAPAFADVSLVGVEGDAKANVLLTLAIAKEKCDAPDWKIQGLFDNAEQDIDQALHALGYYHATVKKSLTLKKPCWTADFTIDKGVRVIVSEVAITINGDAQADKYFKTLLKKLPLKKDSPLNHAHYQSMKSMIEALALERGYLQSRFTENTLLIDKKNNTAQIKLTFASGKRLLFGDITVDQSILAPEFVEKYLTIKKGDFYTGEKLAETHDALSKSGYFDSIDIRPTMGDNQQERVPVVIKLSPRDKYHYGFGAGYDTDIGPLLNATTTHRRINRWGHFLSANLDISPVLSTADVEYTLPLAKPSTDFFSVGVGIKREDTTTYKSLAATLSARYKHAFDNSWKQTLFLDVSYEDFDAGATTGQTLLLIPGGNWLLSVANNPLRPTKGHRLEFEVKGSDKNTLSDVSFLQAYGAAVWLHPLPLRGKFIGRAELGATVVDQFDKLPTTYRFYAGGMNSVRGYAYKELGPKDTEGHVIGGTLLSVVSAEYEQAMFDNWALAAFIDSGNAFNPANLQFKTGAGVGLRWYSPLGPLRVDFALPLNESDSTFQIHFAAGTRL